MRTTIKKILVPYDFSPTAREALVRAGDLARRYDAEVTILHVYQLPGVAMGEGYVLLGPETVTEMLRAIDRDLAAAKALAEGLEVRSVSTATGQGTPHREIVRTAQEQGFDLIVMGTHGRSGFSHALLGSVAEKVVRKAPCPVLTVRSPAAS